MERNLNSFISTLQPQEVTVVAGVPGSGKTSLELSVAVQCAMREKKKVAIFSIEMLSVYIIQRLLCQYAEVNLKKMVNGEFSKDEWDKFTSASSVLQQSKISIDDSYRISPKDIFLKCQALEKTMGKLDLIIIDYLQLLSDNDKTYSSFRERHRLLYDGLKQIAVELNVAVLVATQRNRRLEGREYSEWFFSEEIQPLWLIEANSDLSKVRLEAVHGENIGKVIPLTFDSESLRYWET